MNNPQRELGKIEIATGDPENDVFTAIIRAQLTGVEYQAILFILRKTWGWIDKETGDPKKEDWISLEQFVEVSGRTERGILNALISLDEQKIIVRRKDGRRVYYSLNKRFHGWSILNPCSVNKNSVEKIGLNKNSVKSRSKKTELPCISQLNKSSDTKEELLQKTKVTKETPLPPAHAGDVSELIEFFKEITERKTATIILNNKRRRAIKARLAEFTAEKMRVAWKMMSHDPFLTGENDRGVNYLTIDYALRSDRIEFWYGEAEKIIRKPSSAPSQPVLKPIQIQRADGTLYTPAP